MSENKDIFDRIMTLPLLRVFEGFYKRNKSALLYVFFGGLTTLVSIVSFKIVYDIGDNTHAATIVSWVLAVLFAYVTNRTWVFENRARGRRIIREAMSFFTGRVATLLLEYVILLAFIDGLGFNPLAVKVFAQVAVFVSNYLLSKFIVFKK